MKVILWGALALALTGCEPPVSAAQALGACKAEGMRTYATSADSDQMVRAYLAPCMAGKGFKEISTKTCVELVVHDLAPDAACFGR